MDLSTDNHDLVPDEAFDEVSAAYDVQEAGAMPEVTAAPALTVVVPLYNKGPYIERCLASLRAQSLAALEVLVVDDGSRDDGAARVVECATLDPRLRLIRQKNGGVSRARNTGVAQARAAWVAFLDADDEWRPDFAEVVLNAIARHPRARLVSTAYRCLCDGAERQADYGFNPAVREFVDYDLFGAWQHGGSCPILTSATAMHRDTLLSVGGFPTGVNLGEDLLCYLAMVQAGSYVYINEPHVIYHLDAVESLARSPSLSSVLGHQRLLDELDRLVDSGRCPAAIRDHHRDIHAWHLTRTSPRQELWRFLMRTPSYWSARVWLRSALAVVGIHGGLRHRRSDVEV